VAARFLCSTPGTDVTSVYFPTTGVVSVVARMNDGGAHEVGVIGRDSVVGASELLFAGPALYESFVQVAGSVLELEADIFAGVLAHDRGLREAALRNAHANLGMTLQSAACNGTHGVRERCAKWLLIAHDRVPGDAIGLTHEFLGQMLNVRRAGVTNAAIALQKTGAIRYTRGRISILDRTLLASLSCECYRTMNDNSTLVLGYDVRKPIAAGT
jgi:CRP-like cAMP-binding protein